MVSRYLSPQPQHHQQDSFTDYKFLEQIGRGHFGCVWYAQHISTQKVYAIKQISHNSDQKKIDSIKFEIGIHSSLKHQHIVKYITHFLHKESFYIVMEHCEKGSVSDLMKKTKIEFSRARRFIAELVQALKYLHSKSIVHRDLKPGNLLIDGNDHIKLCDFGLAIPVIKLDPHGNPICGTPNYIPPEVLNKGAVSLPSDIFALGCVIYTLLHGSSPFKGQTHEQIFLLTKSVSYEIPPDMDPRAAHLINQLLQKDELLRPTIREIAQHPFFSDDCALQPVKIPFKHGFVEVTASGEIILDIQHSLKVLKLLRNQQEIEVYDRNVTKTKKYTLSNLPLKYKKRYDMMMKLVNESVSKRPLVIWNSSKGKFVMFGDKSICMVNENELLALSPTEHEDIQKSIRELCKVVEQCCEPKFPIVVGRSNT